MSNITFFYICIKKLKGLTNKEYKLISTKFVTDNLIPCKRNVTPKYDFKGQVTVKIITLYRLGVFSL